MAEGAVLLVHFLYRLKKMYHMISSLAQVERVLLVTVAQEKTGEHPRPFHIPSGAAAARSITLAEQVAITAVLLQTLTQTAQGVMEHPTAVPVKARPPANLGKPMQRTTRGAAVAVPELLEVRIEPLAEMEAQMVGQEETSPMIMEMGAPGLSLQGGAAMVVLASSLRQHVPAAVAAAETTAAVVEAAQAPILLQLLRVKL